jgi:uncharacterized protein YjbI with pentapeptide repeats
LPLFVHVALLLVLSFILAAGLGLLMWHAVGQPDLRVLQADWKVSDSFDALKIVLAVVAGIGGVVALTVAYRRQRLGEAADRREEAKEDRENTKLFNDRFTKSAELLGSDKAAVRLASVYAIAGLADDWADERQTCIDVLCAYLRMPSVACTIQNDSSGEQQPGAAPGGDPREEREVRRTVIRIIRDRLRLANSHPRSWGGANLDFTGTVFDSGDFSGARFTGGRVSFDHATFAGGEVSFDGVRFSGGDVSFDHATFSGSRVLFDRSLFTGGDVSFDGAKFLDSEVSFDHAMCSGGRVHFNRAAFSGSRVFFDHVTFFGTQASFDDAKFGGGWVFFHDAKFESGEVTFHRVEFSGGWVSFDGATFSSDWIPFDISRFSGSQLFFHSATFSAGRVTFDLATFSGGLVSFLGASFRAEVSFSHVRFLGGMVALDEPADWSVPPSIAPKRIGTQTAGLSLPTGWPPSSPTAGSPGA